MRLKSLLILSLSTALACGGSDSKPTSDSQLPGEAGPTPDGATSLVITITSPTDNATDVDPTNVGLEATFNRALGEDAPFRATLMQGSDKVIITYALAGNKLSLTATPMNLLKAGLSYTFKVEAEGQEASVSFTTKTSSASTSNIGGKVYDLRINELLHPPQLATLLGADLNNAASLVFFVRSFDSNAGTASLLVAVGDEALPAGQTLVPAEAADSTTPAFELDAKIEGDWLGVGPSRLELPLDNNMLTIESFFLTAQVSSDGTTLDHVTFSGVLPLDVISELAGIDLTFLCTTEPFDRYCEGTDALQVAFGLSGAQNQALPLTAFITKPTSASTNVATDATVDVYFSEAVDQTKTTISLEDDSQNAVTGSVAFDGDKATFTPDAALSNQTSYRAQVHTENTGGDTDTRSITFVTQ